MIFNAFEKWKQAINSKHYHVQPSIQLRGIIYKKLIYIPDPFCFYTVIPDQYYMMHTYKLIQTIYKAFHFTPTQQTSKSDHSCIRGIFLHQFLELEQTRIYFKITHFRRLCFLLFCTHFSERKITYIDCWFST